MVIAESVGSRSDDGVAVEIVLVVEAGHGAGAFCTLELGESVRECGPDRVLKVVAIDGEVVAAGLVEGGYPAGVALAFGTEGESLGVLEVGQRLDGVLGFEVVLEAA